MEKRPEVSIQPAGKVGTSDQELTIFLLIYCIGGMILLGTSCVSPRTQDGLLYRQVLRMIPCSMAIKARTSK